jgi:Eukaryotic aspartyl protease
VSRLTKPLLGLWLNDLDANAGQILFGAINTDKYHGSLQTVPILKTAGEYSGLVIALSGMSLDGVNISSSTLPAAVLLDTGSTLTYLPNDITRSLYQRLHALPDTSSSTVLAYVPCALAQAERSLDFSFSGIKISVPFNELVLPSKGSDGSGLRFHDGTPACLLGIAPNGGGASVLGDSFLRSAYVVYDLANNQVSLAQTNFNATADHYKVIEAGPGGVPDATLVPNPVTDVKGVVAAGGVRLRVLARPTGAGGLLP